jgi:hypothetical protein
MMCARRNSLWYVIVSFSPSAKLTKINTNAVPLPRPAQKTAASPSATFGVALHADPTFELSEAGTSVELNAERQEKATALFNELAAEVTTLINQHWPAIERTADELLRVRIISGDEVDAIIRASGERKL